MVSVENAPIPGPDKRAIRAEIQREEAECRERFLEDATAVGLTKKHAWFALLELDPAAAVDSRVPPGLLSVRVPGNPRATVRCVDEALRAGAHIEMLTGQIADAVLAHPASMIHGLRAIDKDILDDAGLMLILETACGRDPCLWGIIFSSDALDEDFVGRLTKSFARGMPVRCGKELLTFAECLPPRMVGQILTQLLRVRTQADDRLQCFFPPDSTGGTDAHWTLMRRFMLLQEEVLAGLLSTDQYVYLRARACYHMDGRLDEGVRALVIARMGSATDPTELRELLSSQLPLPFSNVRDDESNADNVDRWFQQAQRHAGGRARIRDAIEGVRPKLPCKTDDLICGLWFEYPPEFFIEWIEKITAAAGRFRTPAEMLLQLSADPERLLANSSAENPGIRLLLLALTRNDASLQECLGCMPTRYERYLDNDPSAALMASRRAGEESEDAGARRAEWIAFMGFCVNEPWAAARLVIQWEAFLPYLEDPQCRTQFLACLERYAQWVMTNEPHYVSNALKAVAIIARFDPAQARGCVQRHFRSEKAVQAVQESGPNVAKQLAQIHLAPLIRPTPGGEQWKNAWAAQKQAPLKVARRWEISVQKKVAVHPEIRALCKRACDLLHSVLASFPSPLDPRSDATIPYTTPFIAPLHDVARDLHKMYEQIDPESKNEQERTVIRRLLHGIRDAVGYIIPQLGRNIPPSPADMQLLAGYVLTFQHITGALESGQETRQSFLNGLEASKIIQLTTQASATESVPAPPAAARLYDMAQAKELRVGTALIAREIPGPTQKQALRAHRTALGKFSQTRLTRFQRNRRRLLKGALIAGAAAAAGVGLDYLYPEPRRRLQEWLGLNGRGSGGDGLVTRDSSFPGVDSREGLRNSPVVLTLSRQLEGDDAYLLTGYLGDEDSESLEEFPLSGELASSLNTLLPIHESRGGEEILAHAPSAGQGAILPTSMGATNMRVTTQECEISQRTDGTSFIRRRARPGPLDYAFTVNRNRLPIHPTIRPSDFHENRPAVFRPLTRPTMDLERFPEPLRQAVEQARTETVAQALRTIADAVRAYITYDRTSGPVYEELLRQRPFPREWGRNRYIECILRERRGVCAQFARVTQELLRHVGIPSCSALCYWAQGTQVRRSHYHRVAVALVLDEQGRLTRVPVESTGPDAVPEPEEDGEEHKPTALDTAVKVTRYALPGLLAAGGLAVGAILLRRWLRDRAGRARRATQARAEAVQGVSAVEEAIQEMANEEIRVASEHPRECEPAFEDWWETTVQEAYRTCLEQVRQKEESAQPEEDPNAQTPRRPPSAAPDLSSCLLFRAVRRLLEQYIASADSGVPPAFIPLVRERLQAAEEWVRTSSREVGFLELDSPP